jgi:general secretion pathway protein G
MISRSEEHMRPSNRHGFTLLELMVVLLILALIATIAAPQVTKHLRKAKVETAKIQVDALGAAVDSFQIDNGRLPTNEEALKALVERPTGLTSWDGPYIKKKESLIDPWGEPYRYRVPGKSGEYDVYSLGSDKKEGGEGEAADLGAS